MTDETKENTDEAPKPEKDKKETKAEKLAAAVDRKIKKLDDAMSTVQSRVGQAEIGVSIGAANARDMKKAFDETVTVLRNEMQQLLQRLVQAERHAKDALDRTAKEREPLKRERLEV